MHRAMEEDSLMIRHVDDRFIACFPIGLDFLFIIFLFQECYEEFWRRVNVIIGVLGEDSVTDTVT